jgi:hypothetical protein
MRIELKSRLFAGLLGLGLTLLMAGCQPAAEHTVTPTASSIYLGYCPTMTPHVHTLMDAYPQLTAIQFENAAMAMDALRRGTIQAALIGRVAREHEKDDSFQLIRVWDGYTLITQNQAGILFEDLRRLEVITSEENTEAHAILPEGTIIHTTPNLDQALQDMHASTVILLRWSQVPSAYQLLIPVDPNGNKVPEFRSPHLYYNENTQGDFSQMIKALTAGK